MSNVISTSSVTVALPEEEQGRGPQMEIDGYQGFAAYVRHYPPNWDAIAVTLGKIALAGGGTNTDIEEWLSFNNSTSVSTSKPITGIGSWGVYGPVWDSNFKVLNKGVIKYNKDLDRFESTIPIYADIEVRYNSNYTVLNYIPDIVGNTFKYGIIRSRLNFQVAQFKVPPPTLGGSTRVELCRVISYYVISELAGIKGSYEMPDDFPENLSYTNTSAKIEEEGSLKVERVHRIYYVDYLNFVDYEDFFIKRLPPYEDAGYWEKKVKFELQKNSAPSGDPDWAEEVFENVDWPKVYESVQKRFPTIEIP